MRLDPIAQEACRYRQPRHTLFSAIELHAPKPAGENILAKFGAQPLFDLPPVLLIRACHVDLFSISFFSVGGANRTVRRGRFPHSRQRRDATHFSFEVSNEGGCSAPMAAVPA